jgi:hypothetical protein
VSLRVSHVKWTFSVVLFFIPTGGVATLLTMPIDVMKTRMMNAPPGRYNSLADCFKDIVSVGPSGFFRGFMPAFIRLGKQSIYFFVMKLFSFEIFRSTYHFDVYFSRTIENTFWLYKNRETVIDLLKIVNIQVFVKVFSFFIDLFLVFK